MGIVTDHYTVRLRRKWIGLLDGASESYRRTTDRLGLASHDTESGSLRYNLLGFNSGIEDILEGERK